MHRFTPWAPPDTLWVESCGEPGSRETVGSTHDRRLSIEPSTDFPLRDFRYFSTSEVLLIIGAMIATAPGLLDRDALVFDSRYG